MSRIAQPDAEQHALLEAVEAGAGAALALSHWMAEHPELSLEERATSERYRAHLAQLGFAVEGGVAGMPTAFLARRGATGAPLCAALLAEMDALPGIGHACGHNLSGPASLLAARALAAALPESALRLIVVGCPAEEIGVGKRRLVEAGVFAEADVAMMAHASDMRRAHRLFLGNRKIEFVFHGRAAHAAAYPERGINALDAVIALFVNVGLLRQQLPRSARIHGIVTDGGKAPNVIPERAAALFWVRALEDDVLENAYARVVQCAEAAAAAAGAQLELVHVTGESPQQIHGNAGRLRPAGARRNDDSLGRRLRHLIHRDRVVADDSDDGPQLTQPVRQIPGERVVVVEEQNHARYIPRLAISSAAISALALSIVS